MVTSAALLAFLTHNGCLSSSSTGRAANEVALPYTGERGRKRPLTSGGCRLMRGAPLFGLVGDTHGFVHVCTACATRFMRAATAARSSCCIIAASHLCRTVKPSLLTVHASWRYLGLDPRGDVCCFSSRFRVPRCLDRLITQSVSVQAAQT